jgi:cystathionine beta-lyase
MPSIPNHKREESTAAMIRGSEHNPDYDFGRFVDRRPTDSVKWLLYGDDVLPLWVADMDFPSPQPVIDALRERVNHGIFGYGKEPPDLRPVIVERLERLYGWHIAPESLVFVPGVVTGFNLATHAVTSPGDGVLVQTPVYFPMLYAPGNAGCALDQMELTRLPDGQYEIDFDAFEDAITEHTRIFLLCNPHNPVGRVFHRDELEQMAEVCLRNDVVICSDEIHCDLVFPGHPHLPIASLAPEIADQTITLIAPSKTYNIAGLHCSVAIIQNAELREKYQTAGAGLVGRPGILGFAATLAAYRHGQPWLDAVLCYLEANRDYLVEYVNAHLPGITMASPEGTYLGWLDCRQAGIGDAPHNFFLEQARVALNDGATFGKGGEGFVRLNFGCPRSILHAALEQMRRALGSL